LKRNLIYLNEEIIFTYLNVDYQDLVLNVGLLFYMLNEINDVEKNLIDLFFHLQLDEYDRELSWKTNHLKRNFTKEFLHTGTQDIICGRRTCISPFSPRFIAVDWSVKVCGDE
jgi:hypothetical protein